MRYGYTFDNNAARTIHNAHAVGTSRSTAKVARALGKPEDAAVFDAWADDLSPSDQRQAAAPGRHLHRRSELRRGQSADREHRAARADLPDLLRRRAGRDPRALAEKIVEQGMRQGPMTWHVLLKALTDLGRYDQVVKLMTDANADGPARTLAQQGTFMWEQWNPGCTGWPCVPTNNESMSHGWGAWALVDMIETLLGVEVTSPGAATVRIEPPAVDKADLNRVSGSAWTQRGTVHASWKRAHGTYVLDVNVPANQRPRSRSRTRAA